MLMCNFFIFQHFVEDFYAYACERCFSSFGITVILALENELKSVPLCFIFLKEIVLFLPWMIGRVFQHNYMIPEFYCWKVSSYELSLIDTRLLRLLIYEDAIVVYAYKEMYPLDLIPQNKVYVISLSTAPSRVFLWSWTLDLTTPIEQALYRQAMSPARWLLGLVTHSEVLYCTMSCWDSVPCSNLLSSWFWAVIISLDPPPSSIVLSCHLLSKSTNSLYIFFNL